MGTFPRSRCLIAVRSFFTTLLTSASLAILAGCSSVDPSPSTAGVTAPPPASATDATNLIPRADVERDLVLELRRASTEPLDHERDPRIEVWLVNHSATRSYPVVLANDGSEMGWREPHAFFGVEVRRASGAWEPAQATPGARCGMYARDWEKDVVTLAPGERIKMPWMPYEASELGDASMVRIVARYAYGAHARDKSKVPPVLHAMPEYAIASAPLEIPVAHPYGLELKMKSALPTSAKAPVAAAVDVVVENRSTKTAPVGTSESGAQLWFEGVFARADGSPQVRTLYLDTEPTYASKDTLAAGARRSIVTTATRTEIGWSLVEGERLVKMRAIWRIWDEDGGHGANVRRVESAWMPAR